MDGEAGILQNRIQVAALERRIDDAQERVRSGENEQIEGNRNQGLHAQHVGAQTGRQIAAEQRDQSSEHAEDEDPQQHRALMVSPHAGDLVDQRLGGVRILEHIDHGEIRPHVAGHQRAEGDGKEAELRNSSGTSNGHEHGIILVRANGRHAGLNERHYQREHERVMAELGDHCGLSC